MNRTTFQQQLTLLSLSARHTGDSSREAITALSDLWWRKYGEVPDDILLAAFGQALDTCKFFPSIAEFNEIIAEVKRAAGVGDPRAEDEVATLLKKISRYNPDLGIVNDGTRGLIIAGQANRGEDNPHSGFTDKERHVLRQFGGAARCAAWDAKDVQFNRPRLVEAFKHLADDARVERQYDQIAEGGNWLGGSIKPLPMPQRPRLVAGGEE